MRASAGPSVATMAASNASAAAAPANALRHPRTLPTANTTVSNSLQFDMQGVLRGFPLTPVWYEVHTPDGQLWDFGAMPPTPDG